MKGHSYYFKSKSGGTACGAAMEFKGSIPGAYEAWRDEDELAQALGTLSGEGNYLVFDDRENVPGRLVITERFIKLEVRETRAFKRMTSEVAE